MRQQHWSHRPIYSLTKHHMELLNNASVQNLCICQSLSTEAQCLKMRLKMLHIQLFTVKRQCYSNASYAMTTNMAQTPEKFKSQKVASIPLSGHLWGYLSIYNNNNGSACTCFLCSRNIQIISKVTAQLCPINPSFSHD